MFLRPVGRHDFLLMLSCVLQELAGARVPALQPGEHVPFSHFSSNSDGIRDRRDAEHAGHLLLSQSQTMVCFLSVLVQLVPIINHSLWHIGTPITHAAPTFRYVSYMHVLLAWHVPGSM